MYRGNEMRLRCGRASFALKADPSMEIFAPEAIEKHFVYIVISDPVANKFEKMVIIKRINNEDHK